MYHIHYCNNLSFLSCIICHRSIDPQLNSSSSSSSSPPSPTLSLLLLPDDLLFIRQSNQGSEMDDAWSMISAFAEEERAAESCASIRSTDGQLIPGNWNSLVSNINILREATFVHLKLRKKGILSFFVTYSDLLMFFFKLFDILWIDEFLFLQLVDPLDEWQRMTASGCTPDFNNRCTIVSSSSSGQLSSDEFPDGNAAAAVIPSNDMSTQAYLPNAVYILIQFTITLWLFIVIYRWGGATTYRYSSSIIIFFL